MKDKNGPEDTVGRVITGMNWITTKAEAIDQDAVKNVVNNLKQKKAKDREGWKKMNLQYMEMK